MKATLGRPILPGFLTLSTACKRRIPSSCPLKKSAFGNVSDKGHRSWALANTEIGNKI